MPFKSFFSLKLSISMRRGESEIRVSFLDNKSLVIKMINFDAPPHTSPRPLTLKLIPTPRRQNDFPPSFDFYVLPTPAASMWWNIDHAGYIRYVIRSNLSCSPSPPPSNKAPRGPNSTAKSFLVSSPHLHRRCLILKISHQLRVDFIFRSTHL